MVAGVDAWAAEGQTEGALGTDERKGLAEGKECRGMPSIIDGIDIRHGQEWVGDRNGRRDLSWKEVCIFRITSTDKGSEGGWMCGG